MTRRSFPFAALLILVLLAAAVRNSTAAPRRSTFWACSDGAGTILLFWLPVDGEWPEGGFRLERVSGKRKTVIAQDLRPGADEESMSSIDPWDAVDVRILAERIRYGTLTDEERENSMKIMGKMAALDMIYGRALGVRYVDRTKESGILFYRLAAIGADGGTGHVLTSNEVNPMRPTPGPEWPAGLRAEVRHEGISLFWEEPPGGDTPPVVAYRVGRGFPGGRSPSLTKKPVEPNRGGEWGDPSFVDGNPPRETVVYQVQSVDIFARVSAPVKVRVEGGAAPPSPETPLPSFAASLPPEGKPPRKVFAPRNLLLTGTALPPPRPDSETEETPDEEERSSVYRKILKDSDVGIPVPVLSPRGSESEPPEPPSPPPPMDPPRSPGEQERIDLYRRIAEAGESGETLPVPPFPEFPVAASPLPPSPPPVVDAPASPEERDRIEMYRMMVEGTAPWPAAPVPARRESAAGSPETVPPVAVPGLPREPQEEERIDAYRRIAEDRERGIEESPAPDTAAGEADQPPAPIIDAILITDGNVSIGFFPGGPSCPSCGYLVFRNEDRGNPAPAPQGSLPPDARHWTDTGVAAGKNYWYRIVAVAPDGRKSPPSVARWVRVPER